MYSTGPRDDYRSPVTVQVDATFLEKGEFQDRTSTAWQVRKGSPAEILATGEFEGPHWQSLRRRDTPGKRRETNKPHSILVKRGDMVAEVEKYLSDCVFVPALERVRQSRKARANKHVQWWDSPTGKNPARNRASMAGEKPLLA
jgi:hypothetical protein